MNRTKNNKLDSPVGHYLIPKDFLECIDEVRQSLKHEQDMFYLTKPPGKDPQEKEGKDNGKKADETKPKNKKEYKTFDGNLSQVLYLHLQLRFNPFRKRVKIFVLFVASRKLQSSTTSS